MGSHPVLWREQGDLLKKKHQVIDARYAYSRATKGFKNLIKENPNHQFAFYYLGTIYERFERFDDALDQYDKQISVNKSSSYSWYRKGLIYEKRKNFNKAIEAYEHALKLNKNMKIIFPHLKEVGNRHLAVHALQYR